MPVSRRSVLRNLGALSAAQTIPLAATSFLAGCKSKQPAAQPKLEAEQLKLAAAAPKLTSPATDSIYLLFEGPWLFTNIPNQTGKETAGQMVVRAILGDHLLQVGRWDGTQITDENGNPNPLSPRVREQWNGNHADPNAPLQSFADVFNSGFKADTQYPAPFLTGFTVPADPTQDVAFSLPVPNVVMVGGRLTTSTIVWRKSARFSLYTTTILKYTPNKASLPVLTLSNGTTSFTLKTVQDTTATSPQQKQHFLFRLTHPTSETTAQDVAHIKMMFSTMSSRLSPPPADLLYDISSTDFQVPDPGSVDGISIDELGVKADDQAKAALRAAERLPKSASADIKQHRLNMGYSNCAGGGMADDCCS